MMFIFDTEYSRTESAGPRLMMCGKCERSTNHDLSQTTCYVTALEVPIFPHRICCFATCRVCGEEREIPRSEFTSLSENRTSPKEDRPLHQYQKSLDEGMKFCRQCGKRMKKRASFCSHCGSKARS